MKPFVFVLLMGALLGTEVFSEPPAPKEPVTDAKRSGAIKEEPIRGKAELRHTRAPEFHVELDGYLLTTHSFELQGVVIEADEEGFDFEASTLKWKFAEPANPSGKRGRFVYRMPGGAKVALAVGDKFGISLRQPGFVLQRTYRLDVTRGNEVVLSIGMLNDKAPVTVEVPLKLPEENGKVTSSISIRQLEKNAELVSMTRVGKHYRVPLQVGLKVEGKKAFKILKSAEIGHLTVDARKYQVSMSYSQKIEPSALGRATLEGDLYTVEFEIIKE